MHGVRVGRRHAEEVRRELARAGLLNTAFRIKSSDKNVTFPVTSAPDGLSHGRLVEEDFEPRERREGFRQRLSTFLGDERIELLGRSFDIIGDIAIIEVPEELKVRSSKIAEALMGAHKSVKTVYAKSGAISGEERVRKLELIGGIRKSETVHKESGCEFKLDVEKVYFSPRLSHERERVLALTKDGETIVDLFAGIGPFSILLAKNREVKVHAIDLNPVAYHYLEENIRLNRVGDKVFPILGDCQKAAPRGVADRVIMNLPMSAHEFLGLAVEVIKKGTIHFYTISPEDDLYGSKSDLVKEIAEAEGRKAAVVEKRIVRSYSPHRYNVVLDIAVE